MFGGCYAILAAIGLTLMLGSCGKKADDQDFIALPTESKAQKPIKQFECRLTDKGIPIRVIVKAKDAFAYEKPDLSGQKVPLDFYGRYFVFDENSSGYQVGKATTRAEIVGWVAKEQVVNWDTNLGIYFANQNQTGSEVITRIWLKKEDVGNESRPHFANVLRGYKAGTEPYPIVAQDQGDGDLINVALLWSGKSGADINTIEALGEHLVPGESLERTPSNIKTVTTGDGETTETVVQQAGTLDFVLVIDCTKSMSPYIAEVRQRLNDIVSKIQRIAVDQGNTRKRVRVGVVGYRDYGDARDASSFYIHPVPLTEDFSVVQGFLDSLKAHSGNDRGLDEAVWEGLSTAIDPAVMGEVGKYSAKIILLVGDAAPHDGKDIDVRDAIAGGFAPDNSVFFGKPFGASLAIIAPKLREMNTQVFTFNVGIDARASDAFSRIAKESKGEALNLQNPDAFIVKLEENITQLSGKQDRAVKVVDAISKGTIDPKAIVGKDLEALHLIGVTDPSILGSMSKEPVQLGWSRLDNESAKVCVYIKLAEFERYQEEMMFQLSRKLAGEAINSEDVKRIMEPIIPELPWDNLGKIAEIGKNLPGGRDTVFSVLSAEAQMDLSRAKLKMREWVRLATTPGVFSLTYEEGWIPISLLPAGR